MFTNIYGEIFMFKKIMDKIEDLVSDIITAYQEPLEETEVAEISGFFKIALNHASGNLTDEESEIAVRNLSRSDGWLEGTLTSEWDDGTVATTTALYNPKTKDVQVSPSHLRASETLLSSRYVDVVIDGELVRKDIWATPVSLNGITPKKYRTKKEGR